MFPEVSPSRQEDSRAVRFLEKPGSIMHGTIGRAIILFHKYNGWSNGIRQPSAFPQCFATISRIHVALVSEPDVNEFYDVLRVFAMRNSAVSRANWVKLRNDGKWKR